MKPHSAVIRPSSAALRVAGVKAVSVTEAVIAASATGAAVVACTVVPQAAKPVAKADVPEPAVAALQELPAVATSLTTIDVGTAGVSVLLIRSLRALSETSAFGVTVQLQQDTNCSSGENAYTFTQRLDEVAPLAVAPVLVMLITESPTFRCEAYRT